MGKGWKKSLPQGASSSHADRARLGDTVGLHMRRLFWLQMGACSTYLREYYYVFL